jgi:hypothetical protein
MQVFESTPTNLEIGQALLVALLEVRGNLQFESYGAALDCMHKGLEALADNHAWGSRLRVSCDIALNSGTTFGGDRS